MRIVEFHLLTSAERYINPAPKCDAIVSLATLTERRAAGQTDMHCNKAATVAVGSRKLCRTHASVRALNYVIGRGTRA